MLYILPRSFLFRFKVFREVYLIYTVKIKHIKIKKKVHEYESENALTGFINYVQTSAKSTVLK